MAQSAAQRMHDLLQVPPAKDAEGVNQQAKDLSDAFAAVQADHAEKMAKLQAVAQPGEATLPSSPPEAQNRAARVKRRYGQ